MTEQLMVLQDIREAVGDSAGRLMQAELVERIRGLVIDAERLEEQEVLAEYTQNDGNRQWVSVGTWLYPGDRVLFDQARTTVTPDEVQP